MQHNEEGFCAFCQPNNHHFPKNTQKKQKIESLSRKHHRFQKIFASISQKGSPWKEQRMKQKRLWVSVSLFPSSKESTNNVFPYSLSPPGHCRDPGIEPGSLRSPALADVFFVCLVVFFFTTSATWEVPPISTASLKTDFCNSSFLDRNQKVLRNLIQ